MRLDDEQWQVARVPSPRVYVLAIPGAEDIRITGEFALYREDTPPWDVVEDLQESQSLGGGQVASWDEKGITSLTRASTFREKSP